MGLDFLRKHNARIYLDLGKIRLNEEYVDLDQDIQIGSVVRLAQDVVLPPQSRVTVEGKVGSNCTINQVKYVSLSKMRNLGLVSSRVW